MRGWWRLRFTKEVPFWFWNCAFASDSFPYQKGVFAPFTSSFVIVNERSGLGQSLARIARAGKRFFFKVVGAL